MTGAVSHFIGPVDNSKDILSILASKKIPVKVSKDLANAHLFLEKQDSSAVPETLSVSPGSESEWVQCSGCTRCCSSKKTKGSNQKYTLYPPLILLPTGGSVDTCKANAADLLKRFPQCTHAAINKPIKVDDPVRRPQIEPLIGDFGTFVDSDSLSEDAFSSAFWASSTQNGIFQTWAPMYTMFSRGNITEKKRVLSTFGSQAPISGSTIVDLYAGIGYFTFPYAKQNPKVIYCWEINPWSIEGLLKAAKINKFNARVVKRGERYVPHGSDRIVLFAEDNQHALDRLDQLDLSNLSHINMGLLPDAHAAIPVALKLCDLASESHLTMIHLHENIKSDACESWKHEFAERLGYCRHLETIKQYSPGIIHVCGDFEHKNTHAH